MHGPSQVAADSETETRALMGAGAPWPSLDEWLEDAIELLRGNARAAGAEPEPNDSVFAPALTAAITPPGSVNLMALERRLSKL